MSKYNKTWFLEVLSSVLVPVKMHSGNSNMSPAAGHNDVQIKSSNQSENFQLFWRDRLKIGILSLAFASKEREKSLVSAR